MVGPKFSEDDLECPVCLSVPREGGMVPCPNWHLVCERCFRNLDLPKGCPECRAEYPFDASSYFRCPIAQELLDTGIFDCE